MRVVLDATALPPRLLGAGWYVRRLAEQLPRCEGIDLHVLVKQADVEQLARAGASVYPAGPRNRALRLWWEQTMLPLRAGKLRPDVFHAPHYTVPPRLKSPAVVTFHDPTFFTHPEVHEKAKVAWFTRAARTGVTRARRVIAVSEYAKAGAVRWAGADPSLVDVVHLGADPALYTPVPAEADAKLRANAGAPERYVMWVGAIEPRKDVPTLIRAFESVPDSYSLVVVGPPAWGSRAVEAAVESSRARGRIVRTGYVTEEEKAALYRGAACFVYPSIAEGFGLPVLEAMACGVPVVTTTGSGPEEVGGDAVCLVEPRDVSGLSAAIKRVLTDEPYAADLRARGPARAAGFTWRRTAEQTADVYRRAAA